MKNKIFISSRSKILPMGFFLSALFMAAPSYANPLDAFLSAIGNAGFGAFENAASVLGNMGLSQLDAALTGLIDSIFGLGACSGNGQLSDIICNVMEASNGLPGVVTALAYITGLIFVISGIFKLKEHVLDSGRHPLSDAVKRFVAGGGLFAIPMVTEAAQNLIRGNNADAMSQVGQYAGNAGAGYGLDTMMVALFADLYAPLMSIIFAFAYFAGLILVVMGITRIIKTAQDGPRGPAGFGTIMMFVVAGVFFSLSTMMGSFSTSMFLDNNVATFAVLQTTTGDQAIDDHILAVISTVLVFMTIVGYISFVRGFFILKDVAEGNGQASLMAAVTHMFGGALAVNLGPLMNAVQSTLGLDTLGVMFY